MCNSCWEFYGRPTYYGDVSEEYIQQTRELHPFGALHFIIEDYDVEDDHLEFCYNNKMLKPEEREWLDTFKELTEGQRCAVLAKADWLFGSEEEQEKRQKEFSVARLWMREIHRSRFEPQDVEEENIYDKYIKRGNWGKLYSLPIDYCVKKGE